MSSDTRLVFGISPGPDAGAGREFVFLEVAGTVEDGRLTICRNPRADFPTEGNVHLSRMYWVPPENVAAVWRVRHTRTADPGQRQAEWSVVAKGQTGPVEIIDLPERSTGPSRIRERLIHGLSLDYSPYNQVLLRLADNVVVGPVKVEARSDQADGFICRPEAFNEPLLLWRSERSLQPLTFHCRGHRRTFTSLLQLPNHDTFLDCADLEYAIRSVLKQVKEVTVAGVSLSRKQLEGLSRLVAGVAPSDRLKGRIQRVQEAFGTARISAEALRALEHYLAEQPSIKAEIEQIKQNAREETAKSLRANESALVGRIEALTKDASTLEGVIAGLRTAIATAEQEYSTAVDRIVEQLRARIAKVQEEPAALLAEVALIRPFLASPGARRDGPELLTDALPGSADTKEITSAAGARSALENALQAGGLVGTSAKRMTREVLAAGIAGQLVTFSGSLAPHIARACARALASQDSRILRIPVGLLSCAAVDRALEDAARDAEAHGRLSILLVEGINRSAPEVFGDGLRSLVTERILGVADRAPLVLLFATAVAGPSALPLTPGMCELGPILDTDTLTLAQRPTRGVGEAGFLSGSLWSGWRDEEHPLSASQSEVDELADLLDRDRSLLWRRATREALSLLESPIPGDSAESLSSLAFGWLLPRVRVCRCEPGRFLKRFKEIVPAGESGDPRVKRLLASLEESP